VTLPRSLFQQAASIETANFDPLASAIAAQGVFGPMYGVPADEARVQELAAALEAKVAGYQVLLGKTKYLAGEELTLADLLHLLYGVFLTGIQVS
jgi:glutathione S-transferase